MSGIIQRKIIIAGLKLAIGCKVHYHCFSIEPFFLLQLKEIHVEAGNHQFKTQSHGHGQQFIKTPITAGSTIPHIIQLIFFFDALSITKKMPNFHSKNFIT